MPHIVLASKSPRRHELLRRMGITDFAQGEMGVLVFIDLPQEGDEAVKGEGLCEAESVKAVSEIYSPVRNSDSRMPSERMTRMNVPYCQRIKVSSEA